MLLIKSYNRIRTVWRMPQAVEGVRSPKLSLFVSFNQSEKQDVDCALIDEDENGVRVKVIPCPKEQFRRRLQQTNWLGDDFFVPNRAQLMLDCLRKHGDRIVKEKHAPKRRFSTTLQLVHHVFSSRSKVIMHWPRTALHFHVERRNSVHQLYTDVFPPTVGVCVCHPCNKGLSNPTVNCRGHGGHILAMPTKLWMLTG